MTEQERRTVFGGVANGKVYGSVEQALSETELNWAVRKAKLTADAPWYESTLPVNDFMATVRTDTNRVLGVVGKGYEVVQNIDAFRFLDGLVDEGQVQIKGAFALGGGRKTYILAADPTGVWTVQGNEADKNYPYIAIGNGFDGGQAVHIVPVMLSMLCSNTFRATMSKKDGAFTIRHTASALDRMAKAQEVLRISLGRARQFKQVADVLASKTITVEQAKAFFLGMMPKPVAAEGEEEVSQRRINSWASKVDAITTEWNREIVDRGLTAWAAFNSATAYVDHHLTIRKEMTEKANEDRFNSAIFGNGDSFKQEALVGAVNTFAPEAMLLIA